MPALSLRIRGVLKKQALKLINNPEVLNLANDMVDKGIRVFILEISD